MMYYDDSVVFQEYEIKNLVRLIMLSETEDEVRDNLIKGLSYIFNPKVFKIEEDVEEED